MIQGINGAELNGLVRAFIANSFIRGGLIEPRAGLNGLIEPWAELNGYSFGLE